MSRDVNQDRALKQFYKQQLDHLMQQRNKKKEFEKQQQEQERKSYNERLQNMQQMEKLKDLSYKNYYEMLMANQQQHLQTYVSPFSKRDNMKNEHINHALEEQRQRAEFEEGERLRRAEIMKQSYKKGLEDQMEEHRNEHERKKYEKERERDYYQKLAKLPKELEAWEREKKRDDEKRYREDLDKVRTDKQMTQMRTLRENNAAFYPKTPDNHHNPIYNPVPYNIQNPYIMRDLQRAQTTNVYQSPQVTPQAKQQQSPNSGGLMHNYSVPNSYFANVGLGNLSEPRR